MYCAGCKEQIKETFDPKKTPCVGWVTDDDGLHWHPKCLGKMKVKGTVVRFDHLKRFSYHERFHRKGAIFFQYLDPSKPDQDKAAIKLGNILAALEQKQERARQLVADLREIYETDCAMLGVPFIKKGEPCVEEPEKSRASVPSMGATET